MSSPAPRAAAVRVPAHDQAAVSALRAAFKPKKVPLSLLVFMVAANVPPALAAALSDCPGFKGVKDVTGLVTLRNLEVPDTDIVAWARCGSLDPAWRLVSLGVTPAQAGPVILGRPGSTTAGYLRVVQAANGLGVRIGDVPFWVSAGVFSLTGHPVNEAEFARWRSFGVNWTGMREAALVAAAGMDISEAIGMHERGVFDSEVVAIMAQLNS